MKDLKNTIIKITISAIILLIAFKYLEKKPETQTFNITVFKKEDSNEPPMPQKLQWNEPFKGVSNLPSKPTPKE